MKSLLRTPMSAQTAWMCSRCQKTLTPLHREQTPPLGQNTARPQPQQTQHRSFYDSSCRRQQLGQESQAQPLGDFYTELLNKPIPKASKASSSPSLPTFVRSGDQSKEERAKKLFGNLKGSGYERTTSQTPDATWRTINGVPIPPRPGEPDNCCMSGCVHCVWDDYRDDVEQWAHRLREAQAKGANPREGRSSKAHMARPELASASGSMDDDGGGSETLWNTPSPGADDGDALFSEIPVGIREFMATEKKIRDRKRARKQRSK